MNAIKSFSRAKTFVYGKRKENSAIWLAEALDSLVRKKKLGYFTNLRIKTINKRRVETLKKFTVAISSGRQMRSYFQLWRE